MPRLNSGSVQSVNAASSIASATCCSWTPVASARVERGHQAAGGGADHQVRPQAGLLQHLDHADVREPARRAASECQADARRLRRDRRDHRRGRVGTGGAVRCRRLRRAAHERRDAQRRGPARGAPGASNAAPHHASFLRDLARVHLDRAARILARDAREPDLGRRDNRGRTSITHRSTPWTSRARSSSSPAARPASAKARRACWPADGAKVVIADMQVDKGEAVAREIGGAFVKCDVSQEADGQAVVAKAVSHGQADGPGQLRRHRARRKRPSARTARTTWACSPRPSWSTWSAAST